MNTMHFYKSLIKKYNIVFFDYSKNSFFEGLYRLLGLVISPLLIKVNPNVISFFSLLCGFSGLLFSKFLMIGLDKVIYFFIIAFILDFADGLIARYQKTTSFHGRFIDGLFDILVIGFLHIVLINYLFVSNSNSLNTNFYYITILLLPIQHLILDRYSALTRWCNDINKNKKIKPYVRGTYLSNFTYIIRDLQNLCIVLFLFSSFFETRYLIEIYFILSFLASTFQIIIYILLSKKNLANVSNQRDNKE